MCVRLPLPRRLQAFLPMRVIDVMRRCQDRHLGRRPPGRCWIQPDRLTFSSEGDLKLLHSLLDVEDGQGEPEDATTSWD